MAHMRLAGIQMPLTVIKPFRIDANMDIERDGGNMYTTPYKDEKGRRSGNAIGRIQGFAPHTLHGRQKSIRVSAESLGIRRVQKPHLSSCDVSKDLSASS